MNRTTLRTIQMLELISKHRDGLYLKDIVELMDIPKSSAFDILHTLVDLKMVTTKEGYNKKYVIGVKAFEIGSSYVVENDLIEKAKYDLERLAEEMNATAFIGVRDDTKIVYVFKYQPETVRIKTCDIGKRNHLYNTALGKSILAYTDEESLHGLFERIKFEKTAMNTITNKSDLLIELEKTRERGYSIDFRENEDHMVCVGAPIFDYTGKVIAAISLSDLYDENNRILERGIKVLETARKISAKLGYIHPKQ